MSLYRPVRSLSRPESMGSLVKAEMLLDAPVRDYNNNLIGIYNCLRCSYKGERGGYKGYGRFIYIPNRSP